MFPRTCSLHFVTLLEYSFHSERFLFTMDITVALSDTSLTTQWTRNNTSLASTHQWGELHLDELSSHLFARLLPTILFVLLQIVIGLPGNLLVFLVYFREVKASATRVFVLAMAACDLLTDVIVLPLQLVSLRFQYNALGTAFCRIANILVAFPIIVSAWILVCVSLDRRRRICQPWKRQLNAHQATCLLVLPFALSCLVTLPIVVVYGERHFPAQDNGLMGRTCGFEDGFPYRQMYGLLMLVSLVTGFSLMTFSYVNIALCIYRQQKKRKSNLSGGQVIALAPLQRLDLKKKEIFLVSDANIDVVCVKKSVVHTETCVITQQRSSACRQNPPILITETDPGAPDGHGQASHTGQVPNLDQNSRYLSNASDSQPEFADIKPEPQQRLQAPPFHEVISSERVKAHKESIVSATSAFSFDTGRESSYTQTCQPMAASAADVYDVTSRRGSAPPGRAEIRGSQRTLCSRTTLMMFVLTVTVLVCFLPFAVASALDDACISLRVRSWTLNLCGICRYFPCVNSVLNPFIYSFCNPNFRLQCRQFLGKVHSYLGTVWSRLSTT